MAKTIEQSFIDWEGSAFGFGYGTGEPHVVPALKTFLSMCDGGPFGHSYDYQKLEAALSPTVAWLLINALCQHNIGAIEYGTSPRFGWLTPQGEALKAFVATKTADELIEIVTDFDPDYIRCYPDACNCGPNGYEAGRKCVSPFWGK